MRFTKMRNAPTLEQKKIPTGKEPLTGHYGRAVNPRDRAIFPKLTANEGEKRKTYDMIDPEDLEFPDGWQWVKSKEKCGTGKRKQSKTYKWYNRETFKDKMRRIAPHKPSPTLVAHMAVDTYMYIHPTKRIEPSRREKQQESNPSPTVSTSPWCPSPHNIDKLATLFHRSWPKPSPKKSLK